MFPIRDTIPSRHPPVVTRLLIAVNAALFLFLAVQPDGAVAGFLFKYGVVPASFTHPFRSHLWDENSAGLWSLLTSMFLHGSFLHILSNMWTLWIFGDNVEDRMGHFRFLAFYLLCGVAAMLVHTVTNPLSPVPAIGASGAIAGVMGAYMVLFPGAMVITLIPILIIPLFIPIPAVVYLLLWFLMQFMSGTASLLAPGQTGGVAWWAHIGGFLVGMWCYSFFLSREKPRGPSTAHRNSH
jgi:membrane associated rhomboid family serine protease